jgi:dienelactone hydrolase
MKKLMGTLAALLVCQAAARAEIKTENIVYKHGDQSFKGVIAYDDAAADKRPGILVVHEWWGLNDYAKKRAQMLAKMGYVAFACDMYGDGKTTEHPKEAGALAGAVRKDVKEWQGRALASLQVLRDHPKVDGTKLAAIGYCFGGSTSLQLAYAGAADLKAAVSFHGALPMPENDVKGIKAKILICHGAADSFIPEDTIQKVRAALEQGGADYQMIYYSGAEHSFTVPGADEKGLKGIRYDAAADRRSWAHMTQLFREVFGTATKETRE